MKAQRLIPLVLFFALLVAISRTAVNTTHAATPALTRSAPSSARAGGAFDV